MLFMFSFENIPVSSFSLDDRKWASRAMAEAAAKMLESGAASLSRVTSQPVASFATLLFISLLLCFSVPGFCFCSRIFVLAGCKL